MSKHVVISMLAFASLSMSCATVHVTRLQPGRGGELAVQEGIFGEPAQVKADRVMQGQCPEGYVIEEEADVKVGSTTTTQSETQGKTSRKKIAATSTSVSETHDKTERRITWKCRNAGAEAAPVSPRTESVPTSLVKPPAAAAAPEQTAAAEPETRVQSPLLEKKPTGWTADLGFGRRWYKPEDATVANFHSTFTDIRLLYTLLPGFEVGGALHVDGYDNDSNAADEDFTSSLFELGVSGRLSHRFGNFKPYIVGNGFFAGGGNREYERELGSVTQTYIGKNYSRGIDGAVGLAWMLGEGSLYFEWYRSAERTMTVKGRLETQAVLPNGSVFTTSEADKRSFKTRYDGFAIGVSLPISN